VNFLLANTPILNVALAWLDVRATPFGAGSWWEDNDSGDFADLSATYETVGLAVNSKPGEAAGEALIDSQFRQLNEGNRLHRRRMAIVRRQMYSGGRIAVRMGGRIIWVAGFLMSIKQFSDDNEACECRRR
jgi:hypothetical protein